MFLTKANAGEQINCGVILKTSDEPATFDIHRQWLWIPLESVVLQDGKFTIEPMDKDTNIMDRDASYSEGGVYHMLVEGKALLLFANRVSGTSEKYGYDSDLITIPQENCYISPRGMKYFGNTVFAYEQDWVLQCIAAFFGFYFDIDRDNSRPEIKFIVPPEFNIELAKTGGIKTGQFIL